MHEVIAKHGLIFAESRHYPKELYHVIASTPPRRYGFDRLYGS